MVFLWFSGFQCHGSLSNAQRSFALRDHSKGESIKTWLESPSGRPLGPGLPYSSVKLPFGYIYICNHIYIYIYTYDNTYMYMYICMYVIIYIYT